MANNYMWLVCSHCQPVDHPLERDPAYDPNAPPEHMAEHRFPWVGAICLAKYGPPDWQWRAPEDALQEWMDQHNHEDRGWDQNIGPTCYRLVYESDERLLPPGGKPISRAEASRILAARVSGGGKGTPGPETAQAAPYGSELDQRVRAFLELPAAQALHEAPALLETLAQTITPGPWHYGPLTREGKLILSADQAASYVAACVASGPLAGYYGVVSEGGGDVAHTGNGPDAPYNARWLAVTRKAVPLLLEANRNLLGRVQEFLPKVPEVPVHRCPRDGEGVTPCCGRVPFELIGHRITEDPALVTCQGAEAPSAEWEELAEIANRIDQAPLTPEWRLYLLGEIHQRPHCWTPMPGVGAFCGCCGWQRGQAGCPDACDPIPAEQG